MSRLSMRPSPSRWETLETATRCCPACGDLSLQRQRVKRLIMDLEVEHSGVKQSMLKALTNVMPRHLLDQRLNPSGELRDSAALRLEEERAGQPLIQIQH